MSDSMCFCGDPACAFECTVADKRREKYRKASTRAPQTLAQLQTAAKLLGMVVVPREPTEAMIKAGREADGTDCWNNQPGDPVADMDKQDKIDIYRAMLSAGDQP